MGGPGRFDIRDSVGRPAFLSDDEILANRADAGLSDELREMPPATTDDLDDPWEKASQGR